MIPFLQNIYQHKNAMCTPIEYQSSLPLPPIKEKKQILLRTTQEKFVPQFNLDVCNTGLALLSHTICEVKVYLLES